MKSCLRERSFPTENDSILSYRVIEHRSKFLREGGYETKTRCIGQNPDDLLTYLLYLRAKIFTIFSRVINNYVRARI